ncbi:tetratricopeptide repeat protein [Virgibacillus kimchii]
MRHILINALDLRKSEKYDESNELLMKLTGDFPNDAKINYQCAVSFDLIGEEMKAIPFYKKAIKLGLPPKELEEAYLGLGSSLRALGRYEQSKRILQEAMVLFPESHAIQVFYAMTLYNLKEHEKSIELLLGCIAETSEDTKINQYKKAIRFYADKLDEIWA